MKRLIIAPHPDDEVLGLGGTIAKYAAAGDEIYTVIVTKGTSPMFSPESVAQVREECRQADALLGVKETRFLDFPASRLEEVPRHELNDTIFQTIQEIRPDVVYLPHRGDVHLDHKITVDAAMVALRPRYQHVVRKIYCYETMSETGWDLPCAANEFIPTCYCDISDYLEKKLEAVALFRSQLSAYPNARSLEGVRALAMYRGATVNLRAAEAFALIREIQL